MPAQPCHVQLQGEAGLLAKLLQAHLPEREEDHSLDQHELQKRVERLQQLRCSIPEQDKPVQGQGVAHIVQDGNVEVPASIGSQQSPIRAGRHCYLAAPVAARGYAQCCVSLPVLLLITAGMAVVHSLRHAMHAS